MWRRCGATGVQMQPLKDVALKLRQSLRLSGFTHLTRLHGFPRDELEDKAREKGHLGYIAWPAATVTGKDKQLKMGGQL